MLWSIALPKKLPISVITEVNNTIPAIGRIPELSSLLDNSSIKPDNTATIPIITVILFCIKSNAFEIKLNANDKTIKPTNTAIIIKSILSPVPILYFKFFLFGIPGMETVLLLLALSSSCYGFSHLKANLCLFFDSALRFSTMRIVYFESE
jgi:hypothetical protein